MIYLQEPNIPNPTMSIEIDKVIDELKNALSNKLAWISHPFGRAYRNLKIEGDNNYYYYPEVYKGIENNVPCYHIVKPDNDKKGQCFFLVGKERYLDFERNVFNMLEYDLSIVFMVNLALIDNASLNTELITQTLIRDVRQTITRKLGGYSFKIEITEVVREFQEIFREFNFKEKENYLRAPLQAFRFNCKIVFQEGCYQDNQIVIPPQELNLQNSIYGLLFFSEPLVSDGRCNATPYNALTSENIVLFYFETQANEQLNYPALAQQIYLNQTGTQSVLTLTNGNPAFVVINGCNQYFRINENGITY